MKLHSPCEYTTSTQSIERMQAEGPKMASLRDSQNSEETTLMPGSQHAVLFNPETMFVPTAGYSQETEIRSGKLGYISRQVPLDKSETLLCREHVLAQAEQ